MRPNELLRLLKANGWFEIKRVGSHIHLRHPTRTNTLIVPYHASKDISTGLATKLLKEGGLR